MHALLRLFVSEVESGAPATYSTFRKIWKELKFSFIYEVRQCMSSEAPVKIASLCCSRCPSCS